MLVYNTGWCKHIAPTLLSIQYPRRFLEMSVKCFAHVFYDPCQLIAECFLPPDMFVFRNIWVMTRSRISSEKTQKQNIRQQLGRNSQNTCEDHRNLQNMAWTFIWTFVRKTCVTYAVAL